MKTKVLRAPPEKMEKAPAPDVMDASSLSSIDKSSFIEGLQLNYGNRLHSTAVEEDLNNPEEGQTAKTSGKQPVAAGKRKRRRNSTGEEVNTGSEKQTAESEEEEEEEKSSGPGPSLQRKVQPPPAASARLVGKKPGGRSGGQTAAARSVKKDKKGESESGGETSQEESDSESVRRRRRRVLSSSSEVDEDTSWNPSLQKPRIPSLGRTRKSSGNKSKSRKSSLRSTSAEPKRVDPDRRRRRGGRRAGTELEVVLESFLDFCEQYRESVESSAVRHTIQSFSNHVTEQLLEKISSCKEFKVLKRENTKLGSLIRTNRQRLLDAKQELMRAERRAGLMEKEKSELTLRLADLRGGGSFLRDIRELSRLYLDHRHKDPTETETYGASSLPALLLETKHVHPAEPGQDTET